MKPGLALYIHIPFCSSRCHYCNFYFETGWSPSVLQSVLANSLEELQSMYEVCGKPPVRSIYLGGGTPSIVPPADLQEFLSAVFDIIGVDSDTSCEKLRRKPAELEFEANPESLSSELIEVLNSFRQKNNVARVRVSLGVQTIHQHLLSALGRRSTPAEIEQALILLSTHRDKAAPAADGNPSFDFNTDLIYGIPGQSLQDMSRDIEYLTAFNPGGLSLYQLSVEDGTALKKRIESGRLTPVAAETEDNMWHHACDMLGRSGYRNYEISNFAKPGRESVHNFAYWRLRPYLGIGPSAVSTIANPDKPSQLLRLENPDLFAYTRMDKNFPGGRQIEGLTPQQHFIEIFLTGLRTIAGVSHQDLINTFGESIAPLIMKIREQLSGKITDHSRRIILKNQYRYTMDQLLSEIYELSGDFDFDSEYRGFLA